MGLTKATMVDEIRGLLDMMGAQLKAAGVKEGYLEVPDGSENLRSDFIRPAYKWLHDIADEEYEAVMYVWRKLPEDVWEMYFAIGDYDDHREVIMLRRARARLRERVVSLSRPDFFKKTKIGKLLKELASA